MSNGRILVMGIGNPLMRDEGVGPRVAELLMAGFDFPEHVEVVDAGTMGLGILDLLRDIDHLVVIDAVQGTEHPAGTVVIMSPEEIAPNQVLHSLHDMRLADVLQNAALIIDDMPSAVVIGVQIERIEEFVLELSPACEAALPIALAATLDELSKLEVIPTPREGSDVNAQIISALRTFAPMPDADMGGAAEEPE